MTSVIMVAGLPFTIAYDSNGVYLTAFTQQVDYNGSPLIITINGQEVVNFPQLVNFVLAALIAALQDGGKIVL